VQVIALLDSHSDIVLFRTNKFVHIACRGLYDGWVYKRRQMKQIVFYSLITAIPLLSAAQMEGTSFVTEKTLTCIEDAFFDPSYVAPAEVSVGRGLGDILLTLDVSAFGCIGPAGLSWDGRYLYVVGMTSDSVYVIDPTGPSLVNVFASPPTLSFGIGKEENLWVTCITTDSAYEYSIDGVLTGNAFGCVPSGAVYSADGTEWWQEGEIWFVGVGSACGNQCYKYALPSGTVIDSIGHPAWTTNSQRGISYDPHNEKFWLGGWNSDSVWELNLDGSPTGRSFYMEGCAGIAYDWQSNLHPTPVLWICLHATNQIVMVDADNPRPAFWDFETGEQNWIHTNGGVFPAAWDVVESSYIVGTYTIAPPDAGDSSFCIDGASGGACHDTAMSPVVKNPGLAWLKWGVHFQNYSDYQTMTVVIRTLSGGIWDPWTAVQTYTIDTPPLYDSVDISSVVSDSIQIGFVYDQPNATSAWFAAFDNVELIPLPRHDVGCYAVTSPPEGSTTPGDYDVEGWIRNTGDVVDSFDVVAHVYDTTGMNLIFDQTIHLTLPAGADTELTFGQVSFVADAYYFTEIFTMLAGDIDHSNDTSSVYSRTAIGFGDVIFELDAQAICNDNQLLGLEFDGERFYITGGRNGADPNKVYIVDTAGILLGSVDQPEHATGWGWRDLAWDDVYAGPDRLDTLYASADSTVDYFSVDLTGDTLMYYGNFIGAQSPNRALACRPDSSWFYTANVFSDCYRFNKQGAILQNVPNTYAMYGAAYDDGDSLAGPWVWWHSQDDPGTGFPCQISQMDAQSMAFTGVTTGFALPGALTDAEAGGLCFYRGFRGADVLFALLNGTPNDYIVGIYVRPTQQPGIKDDTGATQQFAFGFAPNLPTMTWGSSPITYSTKAPGYVSLKVYDNMGRLVETLVNAHQPAGEKSVYWNNKDLHGRTVSNGIYFLKLDAEGKTAVQKLIFVK